MDYQIMRDISRYVNAEMKRIRSNKKALDEYCRMIDEAVEADEIWNDYGEEFLAALRTRLINAQLSGALTEDQASRFDAATKKYFSLTARKT